jgi:hypothetical protein
MRQAAGGSRRRLVAGDRQRQLHNVQGSLRQPPTLSYRCALLWLHVIVQRTTVAAGHSASGQTVHTAAEIDRVRALAVVGMLR